MRSLLPVLSLGAVFVVALAGCSTITPADDPMYLRLTDLEARLIRIERVVNNESLIRLAGEVEQLRSETQSLRGEVETLLFETENAATRQRELYLDIDRRLQSLEQTRPRAGFPISPEAGAGRVEAGASDLRAAAEAGQADSAITEAGRADTAPPLAAGSDQDHYQAAFDLIQARRYEEAAEAFRSFLGAFASSPLADNAQYWLAETQYVQRRFEPALEEFEKVISLYPQSAKHPDALLKVGYCNYELQRWDAARAALQRVVREYPETTAARLATQRLERLAQETG